MKLTNQKGFTLLEVIIVIILLGIISSILFVMLQGPVRALVDVQRRTNLVDIAETALQRMTREIRLALPNSLNVTATSVEFLRTIDGARYRKQGANRLKFNKTTDTFEYFGELTNLLLIDTDNTGSVAMDAQGDCFDDIIDCMVVFNTGQSGANAYAGENIAGVTGVTANDVTFDLTGALAVTQFPHQSPRQRFYIVDTPVSFICNIGTGEINRFYSYDFVNDTPTSGTADLLIDNLDSCNMTYDAGTSTRAGLVTIRLEVNDSVLNESIFLMQQAHVNNQP
jgi:MSHA biogenesis protein MshO